MSVESLAYTYVATQQAQTGQALQTAMLKQSAQQDANLVAMLEAGAQSLEAAQASPPPGLGAQVDVTA